MGNWHRYPTVCHQPHFALRKRWARLGASAGSLLQSEGKNVVAFKVKIRPAQSGFLLYYQVGNVLPQLLTKW
jgi:hypothetical protein